MEKSLKPSPIKFGDRERITIIFVENAQPNSAGPGS